MRTPVFHHSNKMYSLLPGDPLPCINAVEHHIPLKNNMPVNAKQYRHPVMHKEFIEKDIQGKLRDGISHPQVVPVTHTFGSFLRSQIHRATRAGES